MSLPLDSESKRWVVAYFFEQLLTARPSLHAPFVTVVSSIATTPFLEPWVGRLAGPYRFHGFTGRPGGQPATLKSEGAIAMLSRRDTFKRGYTAPTNRGRAIHKFRAYQLRTACMSKPRNHDRFSSTGHWPSAYCHRTRLRIGRHAAMTWIPTNFALRILRLVFCVPVFSLFFSPLADPRRYYQFFCLYVHDKSRYLKIIGICDYSN